jgi:3-phenylpropionate/trans-cinnamate dioxygenase ferredoxin reductase component
MRIERVVVAGASLAGVRAAAELRRAGFEGTITVVGAEPDPPYDRPPLSKQVLTGEKDLGDVVLPAALDESLELDWRLGVPLTALDLQQREVVLAGGERVPYDGLVIATGASARQLPGVDHLDGLVTLRTVDDARVLRADLEASPQRVAVVGAGFIGCEVAASCRRRGLDVTLVEALSTPLERVLGPRLGNVVADLHRDHGVDVRLGVGVLGVDGSERVERLRLTDGTILPVDVVVVGIGVAPNTAWLEGSGLQLADGVVCDSTTLAAPGVVAAGDVARWTHVGYGESMRVEHWDNAVAMGTHAGRRLLAGDGGAPYSPLPYFWSDQYDRKIQLSGRCGPRDDLAVVAGSLEERRFEVFFGREGRLVGVLGMNMPGRVVRHGRMIEDGVGWDEALEAAAAE